MSFIEGTQEVNSKDYQVGFSLKEDTNDVETFNGGHGDTIIGVNEVTLAGYIYGLSLHFVNYNAIYLQLWRPVSDEYLPFKQSCRLLYAKKIQPITTNCRSDIYLDECLMVLPGDMVGLFSALVPWSVSRYPHLPDRNILVYHGYEELVNGDAIPEVGSDYILDYLDNFKYNMSFEAHVSQEDPTQRIGERVQLGSNVIDACLEPDPDSIHWEGNEMAHDYIWRSAAVSFALHRVGKYGKVSGFKAYVVDASSRKGVLFQLWKPSDLKGQSYELVAEYTFVVTTTGVNEFSIDESSQIRVDADYRFGIEIPEETSTNYPTPIGSVYGSHSILAYDFAKNTGRPKPVVGDIVEFQLINYPIYYSVQVGVKHETTRYSTAISCGSIVDFGPTIYTKDTTPETSATPVLTSPGKVDETTTTPGKPEATTTSAPNQVVLIGVSAASGVLVIILVSVVLYLCARRKRDFRQKHPTTTDVLPQNVEYDQYVLPRESGLYHELDEEKMNPDSDILKGSIVKYESLKDEAKKNTYDTMQSSKALEEDRMSQTSDAPKYISIIRDEENEDNTKETETFESNRKTDGLNEKKGQTDDDGYLEPTGKIEKQEDDNDVDDEYLEATENGTKDLEIDEGTQTDDGYIEPISNGKTIHTDAPEYEPFQDDGYLQPTNDTYDAESNRPYDYAQPYEFSHGGLGFTIAR